MVRTVLFHPFDERHGFVRVCLAVDAGNKFCCKAEVPAGIFDRGDDGVLSVGIRNARNTYAAGWIPEKLRMAHIMARGILEIFIGQAMQVICFGQNILIERTQDTQNADRLFAPRIKCFHFFGRDGDGFALGKIEKCIASHRAK